MKTYIKFQSKDTKNGYYFDEILKNGMHVTGGPEQYNFSAAGIIPYDVIHDKVYILLNTYNTTDGNNNLFTYFGGKRELSDGGNPKQNAVREAYEESYDIVNNIKHLPISKKLSGNAIINNALNSGKFYVIPKLNMTTDTWNNIYFVKINKNEWLDYRFNNKDSYVLNKEVSDIKWILIDDIFNYISSGKIVSFIASVLSVYYNQIKKFK